MNLRQVVALVRKRWLSLLGCILVGLAAAGAQIYTANPVYSSTARCFVSVASLAEGGSLFQGSQFAQTRVKSYTDIVDSPAVLQPVIQKLDLRMSVQALAQRIVAINPAGTVLINVTASSPDPQRAAQIANAVAAQYSTVIEDLETARAGGQSPVKVTVTGPAVPAGRPTSPRPD